MSVREDQNRVSIYVEKAYLEKPTEAEIQARSLDVVQELREWGWIADVEVVDPTWIDFVLLAVLFQFSPHFSPYVYAPIKALTS